MASVYTRRLVIAEYSTVGEYITVYTAPPSPPTVILRDLILTNSSGAEGYIYLTVSLPLRQPPATLFIWHSAGTGSQHAELRQELLAGERIVATSSVQPWSIALTGFILGAPA